MQYRRFKEEAVKSVLNVLAIKFVGKAEETEAEEKYLYKRRIIDVSITGTCSMDGE